MTPTEFKEARRKLGLTQPQMAEALGVKERTVWKLENVEVPRLYALAVQALITAADASG